MVESAVDRVVVGLVRWTDDDGEQDRMLLPVAREIYA